MCRTHINIRQGFAFSCCRLEAKPEREVKDTRFQFEMVCIEPLNIAQIGSPSFTLRVPLLIIAIRNQAPVLSADFSAPCAPERSTKISSVRFVQAHPTVAYWH